MFGIWKMFYAKTRYSNRFKALFEILFQNMTTACFTINDTGMFLESTTTQNTLFKLSLPKELFDEYKFEGEEIHIGLGAHINQFFKTIKSKTVIEFSITQPFIFDVKVVSKNDNCVMMISANIENVQNIAPEALDIYVKEPINIASTDFSKMCRAFKTQVYVTKNENQMEFSCAIEHIYKKNFVFGKANSDDKNLFHQNYSAEQFLRICKISSFVNQPIKVYAEEGKQLLFACESEIGVLQVFLN